MCRLRPGPGRTPAPWPLLSAHRRPRRPALSPPRPVAGQHTPARADCARARAPTGRPNRGLPTRLADTVIPGNRPATGPRTAHIAPPGRRRAAGPKPAGSAKVQASRGGRVSATRRVRRPARAPADRRDHVCPAPSPPARPAARAPGTGSAPSTAPPDRYADEFAPAGPRGSAHSRHTTVFRGAGNHRIPAAGPDPGVSPCRRVCRRAPTYTGRRTDPRSSGRGVRYRGSIGAGC